jgi:HEAT repeat protein
LNSALADERVFGALQLQRIAGEGEESQEAILEAGASELLVKLLEDNVVWVQEAGALSLATLASTSSKCQAAVAKAGAISPLVQLLKVGDVDVLPRVAASTLRHLAAGNEKNQVSIVRAGAVAPLVEIMRSNSPGARLEAAVALREIAGEGLDETRYGKQVALAQAGAILPLVRLIRDSAAGARQAAAGTLRMLATNNADNQVAIAQAGAIGPLVELLRDAEPGARQEAAAALDHLSVFGVEANFGNQVAIGQAGAIAELSKLLEDAVPDVASAAAGALYSLAIGNVDNLQKVVQAGPVPALVILLKQENVAVSAVALLRYLAASDAGVRTDIPWVSTIEPLMNLLKHEAPQIQEHAASTLASLANRNAVIQDAIIQAGESSAILKGEIA